MNDQKQINLKDLSVAELKSYGFDAYNNANQKNRELAELDKVIFAINQELHARNENPLEDPLEDLIEESKEVEAVEE